MAIAPFDTWFSLVWDPATPPWRWLEARRGASLQALAYLRELAFQVLPPQDASFHDAEIFFKEEYDHAVSHGTFYVANAQLCSGHMMLDVQRRAEHLLGAFKDFQAEEVTRPGTPAPLPVGVPLVTSLRRATCYFCGLAPMAPRRGPSCTPCWFPELAPLPDKPIFFGAVHG